MDSLIHSFIHSFIRAAAAAACVCVPNQQRQKCPEEDCMYLCTGRSGNKPMELLLLSVVQLLETTTHEMLGPAIQRSTNNFLV